MHEPLEPGALPLDPPERGRFLTATQRSELAAKSFTVVIAGALVLLLLAFVQYVDLAGDAGGGLWFHLTWWATWVVAAAFIVLGATLHVRAIERAASAPTWAATALTRRERARRRCPPLPRACGPSSRGRRRLSLIHI